MRPSFQWQLRTRQLALGKRTLIMGVVNVTPDSFSDGGEFFHADIAAQHALSLLEQGADIIDIGGESTRPSSEPITTEEEMRRVIPVIKLVLRERPNAILSIDSYRAATAERAIEAGAEIINDVSGFDWDPQLRFTAARLRAGCVLMHSRGRPAEWKDLPILDADETLRQIKTGLEHSVTTATDAGVLRESIVLDPGLGFGKRFDENYPVLARLSQLASMGFPLLCGASRKSFIERTLSRRWGREHTPVPHRIYGTLAANVAAVLHGAHILRVHDVQPAVDAAAIADEILSAADEL